MCVRWAKWGHILVHFTTVCLTVDVLNLFLPFFHQSISPFHGFLQLTFLKEFHLLGLEALRNLKKTIQFERINNNLLKVTVKRKYHTISTVKKQQWHCSSDLNVKCLCQRVSCRNALAFNAPLFITICKPSSYKLIWHAHLHMPLSIASHLCILNMKWICFTIWQFVCNIGLSHPGCKHEICHNSDWKYHQTLLNNNNTPTP